MKDRARDSGLDDAEGIDDTVADSAETTNDAATQVAAPAARRRKSATIPTVSAERSLTTTPGSAVTPGSTGAQYTVATTPLEALHNEEVGRTRIFLKACIAITAAIAVCLPFMHGNAFAKNLVIAACIAAFSAAGWLLFKIRNPETYSMTIVLPVGAVLAIASYGGVYYWGVFSPAPALILMGIYYFSLGASRRAIVFLYGLCAATQAGLAGLIMTGVVADRGLIRADSLALIDQLMTQGVVQVLFLCTFLIARSSRKTALKAVRELERAVRQVSQREAMLREARQDLDRALQIGGPGRFTEQQLGSFVLGVLDNPDHVNRFIREIEVASSIKTENVVSVLEVGKTEGEIPYLAMERLRGHDLSHHLRKRRRLSIGKTIAMVRQVGRGLAAAHAEGIVHRDIKPQNLFLANITATKGVWKILDFGVSKLAQGGGTLTKGHVVGTPGYMAPEQARGKVVDHRADLYALTAITYRSLTGHPPFSGKDVPTTLYDVVYKMPKQPTGLTRLPMQIDYVLAIGMAKDREKRFDSADELADALVAASKSELDNKWIARGVALIRQHPWGVRL